MAVGVALVFAFVVIRVIMNAVYHFVQHIAHAGSLFAGWIFHAF